MGMYTELSINAEIVNDKEVIQKLQFMLEDSNEDIKINHPLFNTERWDDMLICDSYYFDSQTDSKLYKDNLHKDDPMYFLHVLCNFKNYHNEIKLFLDWLCPYIITEGFLGHTRYEENYNPTLIYKENGKIVYRNIGEEVRK